jgi:hypothetical protein
MDDNCLLCNRQASVNRAPGKIYITCDFCGKYQCTEEAEDNLTSERFLGPKESVRRVYASCWLWENQGHTIYRDDVRDLAKVRPPSVSERFRKVLLKVEAASQSIGQELTLQEEALAGTWLRDIGELNGVCDLLAEQGFVEVRSYLHDTDDIEVSYPIVRLTAKGWSHLEEAAVERREQAFVAMWFNTEMAPTYAEAIKPAIEAAGYRPFRVDQSDSLNKIDDEILKQIRRSRFLVADFTGQRQSVYYEVGFAHGLDLPVFFTIRKEGTEEKNGIDEVHFDTRQYPFIIWADHEELKQQLTTKIEAKLGRGPIQDE